MSKRVFNFSPGPSMLPQAVIEQAQRDLLDWQNLGMSVMEISHRSSEFLQLVEEAENNFRELLQIPSDYQVLFTHGGASLQFSAIPLNLNKYAKADYIVTGQWGQKAVNEAAKFTQVNTLIDTSKELRVPTQQQLPLSHAVDYVHYTPNETIVGVEFGYTPTTGSVPLVADMSSNILSRPIKVSDFGVIYAGAQKNISIAGLGVVIVHKELLHNARAETPTLINWSDIAANNSLFNTPNTFAWYLAAEVFKWLKQKGGLTTMATINQQKASLLYDFIDNSDFYNNPVQRNSRSLMNIPFTLKDESLNATFLKQASNLGLTNLKGHRVIGGMRASIYNAMPLAGVETLIEFMQTFENQA